MLDCTVLIHYKNTIFHLKNHETFYKVRTNVRQKFIYLNWWLWIAFWRHKIQGHSGLQAANILLVHPKCKTIMVLSNHSFPISFLYCSPFIYIIGKVVALNPFASFFVLVLWIGWWFLFCIALRIVIALPTIARLLFAKAFKSLKRSNYRINFREGNQERKQRRLRAITLQGAIEKNPKLLSQYWKI